MWVTQLEKGILGLKRPQSLGRAPTKAATPASGGDHSPIRTNRFSHLANVFLPEHIVILSLVSNPLRIP